MCIIEIIREEWITVNSPTLEIPLLGWLKWPIFDEKD